MEKMGHLSDSDEVMEDQYPTSQEGPTDTTQETAVAEFENSDEFMEDQYPTPQEESSGKLLQAHHDSVSQTGV